MKWKAPGNNNVLGFMVILLLQAINLLSLTAVTLVTKKFHATDLKYGGLLLPTAFNRQRGSCRNPFIQNSLEVTIDELLLNHNLLLLLLSEFLFAFAVRLFVNCCMKTARCKRPTRTYRTPSGSKPSRVNSRQWNEEIFVRLNNQHARDTTTKAQLLDPFKLNPSIYYKHQRHSSRFCWMPWSIIMG